MKKVWLDGVILALLLLGISGCVQLQTEKGAKAETEQKSEIVVAEVQKPVGKKCGNK